MFSRPNTEPAPLSGLFLPTPRQESQDSWVWDGKAEDTHIPGNQGVLE